MMSQSNELSSQISEVASSEDELASSSEQAASATEEQSSANESSISTFGSTAEGIGSMTGMMAGATVAGYGLIDSQTRLQDANLRLNTAQDNLTRAQEAYNAAVEKYGPDSKQAQTALLTLQNAHNSLEQAQNRQGMAQEQVNMQLLMFAGTTIPMVLSQLPEMAAQFGLASGEEGGLTIATLAQEGASKVATAAQWLWNAALDANPIGIVIIAVMALVAAIGYLTNGFRDFKPLIDDVTTAFKIMDEAGTWLYNHTIGPIVNGLEDIANNPASKALMAGASAIGGAISHLASGGIVSEPTIAMIGESGPEAVVPLAEGGSAGSRGSLGQTIQQNNTIHFDVDNIDSRSDYDWSQTIMKQLQKTASQLVPLS